MSQQPARTVILKQTEPYLPEFYRCAARLRARGQVVNYGDKLTKYCVHATDPEGPVLVTDTTEFVFTAS
ncbi:MAG: hypothetical protein ABFD54_18375 [Armatimonadota bacterium]|nr:hypothetical protein [bacterium]